MIVRLLATLLAVLVLEASPAWAGPVEWVEVPATEAGQQWWDSGSVRENREGLRTVLSRFTPAAVDGEAPRNGELFVMQIDCAQKLYRDQQVNGIPRFRAQWQAAGSDELIVSVIGAVCDAPLAS